MSEVLLPPKDLSNEDRNFGSTVLRFVHETDFPDGLLTHPDHVMIKTPISEGFSERVNCLKPWSERVAFLEVDERFLVAAQLVVPLALSQHRPVQWVEIMEPKSPDGTADYIGVEYAQFYHNDFSRAGIFLKKKKVDAQKRTDGMQRWWNIPINQEGQEIRISDKPLSEIIDRELSDGTVRLLDNAA